MWVEYAKKGRYNASQVPPEWHGWLHYIIAHTRDELLMLKPRRYGVEHKKNFSGEGDEYIYHSKGHALNPGQRDWTRYQSWQPTKETEGSSGLGDLFVSYTHQLTTAHSVFLLHWEGLKALHTLL